MSPISQEKLEKMLRQAALDSVVYCPHCEYEPLEADYDKCPECSKPNPLKEYGMI